MTSRRESRHARNFLQRIRLRFSRADWLATTVVGGSFLLLFGGTLAKLFADWARSGEYGHGFILLPIAVYLAWRSRLARPRPARRLGVIVLAAAVILFLFGTIAAEFFTQRFAILMTAAGLALYYAGTRQLRAWWLPFALVIFTIPLPEIVLNSITLPLQLFASKVAVELLTFRHVPAALAGNIIFLPGQELFVAEACSGLRSLSALIGLTLLMAGTGLAHPLSRSVLLLLVVPTALAANAFRVFATGYGVYYVGPQVTEGLLHSAAGVGVFLIALGVVTAAMLIMRRVES